MRYSKSLLPKIQLAIGILGTLAVAYAFFSFRGPLENALTELDNMAGNAESQLGTVTDLLGDVDKIADGLQRALPSHRKSLASAVTTAKTISDTVEKWNQDIPGYQEMTSDAAHICDTFASQLPLKVPQVKLDTKQIKFELPEVVPKEQTVSVNVPTAEVEFETKSVSYPKGANVRTSEKRAAGVKFSYPSGIEIMEGDVDFRYPARIKIGTKKQDYKIPDTPTVTMKDYSFDVPDKLEVTQRELMKDEKHLLEKSSAQMASLGNTLGETAGSLTEIASLLSEDVVNSIQETDTNLMDAESTLTVFRQERLPSVVADLKEQKLGLNKSRQLFTAIAGLIPLSFCILALITIAIALSGWAKMIESSPDPPEVKEFQL